MILLLLLLSQEGEICVNHRSLLDLLSILNVCSVSQSKL